MNEDKLLVLFGCRRRFVDGCCCFITEYMLWLEFVAIITTATSTTIVVHTTQLLLSDTIYTPHIKQINMIWLVYCVTELVLLVFVCLLLFAG